MAVLYEDVVWGVSELAHGLHNGLGATAVKAQFRWWSAPSILT